MNKRELIYSKEISASWGRPGGFNKSILSIYDDGYVFYQISFHRNPLLEKNDIVRSYEFCGSVEMVKNVLKLISDSISIIERFPEEYWNKGVCDGALIDFTINGKKYKTYGLVYYDDEDIMRIRRIHPEFNEEKIASIRLASDFMDIDNKIQIELRRSIDGLSSVL